MTPEEAERQLADAIESGEIVGDCVIVEEDGTESLPAGAVELPPSNAN